MKPALKKKLREMREDSENLILKELSQKVFASINPHLETVEMPLTELLYMPKQEIKYIYFPDTSVISVVTTLQSGDGVEAGIIGREGVLGAANIFAGNISILEATVQLGGKGRRMKTSAFAKFFNLEVEFRNLVLSYVYSFIAQISQNSACLCYHSIEKRLARWLLMFDDRKARSELVLTQEYIAQMLGVRRPSVSINAKKLQDQGMIEYNRGIIRIIDRPRLKSFACECYEEINQSLNGVYTSV